MFEGIIKDRYDDSDHMIDYSGAGQQEQITIKWKNIKIYY